MSFLRSSSSADSSSTTEQTIGPSAKSSASPMPRKHSSRPMSPASSTPSSPVVNPVGWEQREQDFEDDCNPHAGHCGDIETELDLIAPSDELPTKSQLEAARDMLVYDAHGQSQTFGSLFLGDEHMGQRQLIIFVRHFYCLACQAYLKVLTETFKEDAYFRLPIPTRFIVIGCGSPHLIPRYSTRTNCPFRVYAEPTRKLYKALGMGLTVKVGKIPDYTGPVSAPKIMLSSFSQMGRSPSHEMFKGGNMIQVGGEFLFEEGRTVWCHRMRNVRNHSEMSVLKRVLEMDDSPSLAGRNVEKETKQKERKRSKSLPRLFERSRQNSRAYSKENGRTKPIHSATDDSEDPTMTALPETARTSVSIPRNQYNSLSNFSSSRNSVFQPQALISSSPPSGGGLKVIWDSKGQAHLGRESRAEVV